MIFQTSIVKQLELGSFWNLEAYLFSWLEMHFCKINQYVLEKILIEGGLHQRSHSIPLIWGHLDGSVFELVLHSLISSVPLNRIEHVFPHIMFLINMTLHPPLQILNLDNLIKSFLGHPVYHLSRDIWEEKSKEMYDLKHLLLPYLGFNVMVDIKMLGLSLARILFYIWTKGTLKYSEYTLKTIAQREPFNILKPTLKTISYQREPFNILKPTLKTIS